LLHFGGAHPPAALATLELLKPRLRGDHELTDRIVRSQAAAIKARNVIRQLNYEVRWRARAIDRFAGLLG
jgi:hypothetical protein